MKKHLLLFVATLGLLTSCEEDLVVYDVENGQTLAQFSANSATVPTPEEGAETSVTVLVTTVSDQDRQINVSVNQEASTASADQYSVSALTIPAGSYEGTVNISANFDALPEQGSTFLVLDLDGVGSGEALTEKDSFTVEFFRKCPIVPAELVGSWSGPGSWSEHFDYTTEIETMWIDGELYMNGLAFQWFQGWWGEVIVTNEPVKVDIDVETGEITIEEQFYITSTWNGAPQPAYNLKATGQILNACEKTMVIYPVLVQNGEDIDGTAWASQFKETVQLD